MAGLTAAVFLLLAAVAVVGSVGYVRTRLALSREAAEHAKADRQGAEAVRQRARAENNLYHSLVREAQAIRRLRDTGYRHEVWDRLKQALALETPDKDPAELRQEAVACLGDFVGLAPTTWTDFTSNIRALAIHPDGRRAAFGLQDGTVLLRHLATGAEVVQSHEHRAPVIGLSFAAAGNRMASADAAGMVMIWQATADDGWVSTQTIRTERPRADDGPGVPPAVLVTLTSDGESLITYSSPQPALTLWNLKDGTQAATIALPGPGQLGSLTASPDGRLVAAAYRGKLGHRLVVWDRARARSRTTSPRRWGSSTKSPSVAPALFWPIRAWMESPCWWIPSSSVTTCHASAWRFPST